MSSLSRKLGQLKINMLLLFKECFKFFKAYFPVLCIVYFINDSIHNLLHLCILKCKLAFFAIEFQIAHQILLRYESIIIGVEHPKCKLDTLLEVSKANRIDHGRQDILIGVEPKGRILGISLGEQGMLDAIEIKQSGFLIEWDIWDKGLQIFDGESEMSIRTINSQEFLRYQTNVFDFWAVDLLYKIMQGLNGRTALCLLGKGLQNCG